MGRGLVPPHLGVLTRHAILELAMPTRASKSRPRDPNLLARSVVEDLIGEHWDGTPLSPLNPAPEKNPAAVALSKLGAAKGGRARAAALSPKKRSIISRNAAKARWNKKHI